MNELQHETSPYLLQHANNPVHWKAYNDKSLETAKDQDKLMIISVGYSACHWCHVMEHDSFESEDAAQIMNSNFISIKVDREERPDVDAVYMKAVQLMGSQGGWPLNIVALPDGRPIWGGTYFPKKDWMNYLSQLAEMYQSERPKLLEYADKLQNGIETISSLKSSDSSSELQLNMLVPLVTKWKKSFDHEFGGMARAPKFMMPNNYTFLLNYADSTNDIELLDFVNLTLQKMAFGGLFDTVDGGFSRYSVDMKWHVPHFEKMLYDNGQLVSLYSDAYKVTKNELYREVVEKTLKFVARELTADSGAYFSALDADSLNENGKLEEGAFYVWKMEELKELIPDFELFSIVFNINDFGFWEDGNFVLIQNQTLEQIATDQNIEFETLKNRKKEWEHILYEFREKRSKPRLDDKSLTSWNAIMLKGYVDAFKAFGNDEYLNAALRNATFILNHQLSPEGNLFRSHKNGKSTINAYLEDYVWVVSAFIALYEVTLDENWLTQSRQLVDYCYDHFYDEREQFFAFTSNLDAVIIARHFETEDNVIASSNSVMAQNLIKLSVYFSNTTYHDTSITMLRKLMPLVDYPSAYANWLTILLQQKGFSNEVAICGESAKSDMKHFNSLYFPNHIFAATNQVSQIPFLQNRYNETRSLYYICENGTCNLPLEDINTAISNLKHK